MTEKVTVLPGGKPPTTEEEARILDAIGTTIDGVAKAYPDVIEALTRKAKGGDLEAIALFLDVFHGWRQMRGGGIDEVG